MSSPIFQPNKVHINPHFRQASPLSLGREPPPLPMIAWEADGLMSARPAAVQSFQGVKQASETMMNSAAPSYQVIRWSTSMTWFFFFFHFFFFFIWFLLLVLLTWFDFVDRREFWAGGGGNSDDWPCGWASMCELTENDKIMPKESVKPNTERKTIAIIRE